MPPFPFHDWLVLIIALVTTVLWLASVYYAASKGAERRPTS